MDNELSDEQWEQIEEALFAGRKIEAIGLFRQWTGVGLKDAKHRIEDYEKDLRNQFPDRFSKAANKSGCLVVLGILGGGILSIVMALIY